MITLRHAQERGHANHGWLDSWHSFSFADYFDPAHMGWGPLRVINDDTVAPGEGFPTHGHRDMEIISYVLDGALEHKDSLGTGSVIRPGEVQRMSAGRGILHSEYNPSRTEPAHFLQIWIEPAVRGLAPGYEQVALPARTGRLALVASPQGGAGAVRVHQDVRVYAGRFAAGQGETLNLLPGRLAYVHVARGRLTLNGLVLGPGDGARIGAEPELELAALEDGAEVLVFDLPPAD